MMARTAKWSTVVALSALAVFLVISSSALAQPRPMADAETHAKEYLDKCQEVFFTGGLCTGVKPVKVMGTESTIAKVVAENTAKLQAKIAATPEPPVPSTAPPMEKVPPEKKGK